MQIKSFFCQMGSAVCLPTLAAAGLFALLSPLTVQSAHAQRENVAPPGDSLPTAGPLAENLSPKFTKAELATALKIVAHWQPTPKPAVPETHWTWAALYTGFM